ncbi:MAG: trypsin-like serine protease [Bdellovibrionota bacterium]
MKKSLCLFVIFLFVACGKGQKKNAATHTDIFPGTEEEFRESLNNAEITAPTLLNDEPQENPTIPIKSPGVGIINIVTSSNNSGTMRNSCTATLINDNEIITAAHCAVDNQSPEEICKHTTFSHALEEETFTCSKILWNSYQDFESKIDPDDKKTVRSDILIIQLSKAPKNIQVHSLSNQFVSKNENLKALVYSPVEMKESELTLTQKAPLSPFKKNSTQYFFAAYACSLADTFPSGYPFRSLDCPIIEGNSGGPVFNTKMEIQGIIGGCIAPKTNKCSDGQSGGYMTDLGCMKKVNGKYAWRNNCPKEGVVNLDLSKL